MTEGTEQHYEASFRIKTPHGEIEAKGPKEFVEQRANWVEANFNSLGARIVENRAENLLEAAPATDEVRRSAATSKPTVKRRTGPSCASRILDLKNSGCFGSPTRAAEIGEKLREQATPYEGKHIAASLVDLVKRGELRRVKDGGEWTYVNP